MENDEAFGDLAVIAKGDFFQLPPVCPSETLCAAALSQLNGKVSIDPDKIMTGPRSTGIHLFVTFRKFELTEQMRAAGDVKHAELLAHLRSTFDIPVKFGTYFFVCEVSSVMLWVSAGNIFFFFDSGASMLSASWFAVFLPPSISTG